MGRVVVLVFIALLMTEASSRLRPEYDYNDNDNDGIPDNHDDDDDNDGIIDVLDPDDDNDGIPDSDWLDSDGDGIPDEVDNDDDNDGIPNKDDEDSYYYGIDDVEDTDYGIFDDKNDDDNNDSNEDPDNDTDGDGIPDNEDLDDDGDGWPGYQLTRHLQIDIVLGRLFSSASDQLLGMWQHLTTMTKGWSCNPLPGPIHRVSPIGAFMSSLGGISEAAVHCIDGKAGNGKYCGTDIEDFPWIAIQLSEQDPVAVKLVTVINRSNCPPVSRQRVCADRLKNLEVRVANMLPTSSKSEPSKFTEGWLIGTFKGPGEDGDVLAFAANEEVRGRYVVLQAENYDYLHFDEVMVHAA